MNVNQEKETIVKWMVDSFVEMAGYGVLYPDLVGLQLPNGDWITGDKIKPYMEAFADAGILQRQPHGGYCADSEFRPFAKAVR